MTELLNQRLLNVESIQTRYGTSQALFDVSLAVERGQVVALMGRNGMGKSTTIRSICRLTPAHAGRINFGGKNLQKLQAHKVAQLGIGLVPEGRRCFPNLSVKENLLVAARPGPWTLKRVLISMPRLAQRQSQSARTLSGGEQQMLAIGRALLLNPKLLILDEATEGLAPVIRQEIWSILKGLKAGGQSILIVDKTLDSLLPLTDQCFILEKGRTMWSGTPGELSSAVADRYLGV